MRYNNAKFTKRKNYLVLQKAQNRFPSLLKGKGAAATLGLDISVTITAGITDGSMCWGLNFCLIWIIIGSSTVEHSCFTTFSILTSF